jgi:hydrophobe/amphiphile efflux-3 (HAE3) family protein
MSAIDKFLNFLVEKQTKHYKILFIMFMAILVFAAFGVPKVEMESDMAKSNPQDLPIYKIGDRVSEKFGGQDVILILITMDDKYDSKDLPKDIRDISVIRYMDQLSASIELESSVESATSFSTYMRNIPDYNQENVEGMLKAQPSLNAYFSDDFKSTFVMVKGDVGSGEKKVTDFTTLIQDKIDSFSKPPGTKIMITGNPPMQITLLNILFSDATRTLMIAFVMIFVLLILIERSLEKAVLVSFTLVAAITLTIGTMGWIGLQISIATAGLGAMILGLGVEYGVFVLTRYLEEKHIVKDRMKALKRSVPGVGSAILGSSLTTTAGFLALTLSVLPMLQKLGTSLALGIVYCLVASVFISPVLFLVYEDIRSIVINKWFKSLQKKLKEEEI